MINSKTMGDSAENLFVKLRGDNIVRKASFHEDVNEHWDYLDREFGKVDVKAAKRFHRHGEVNHTIWWELRTVKRPPKYKSSAGWGIPNGIDRLIAVQHVKKFILVNPDDLYIPLKERCKDFGRGEFLLHSRPGRGDLMTILPLDFLSSFEKHSVEIPDD